MTPVRCCMAGCRKPGEFFEPDPGWWFCGPCFDIHLAIRREERARRKSGRRAS